MLYQKVLAGVFVGATDVSYHWSLLSSVHNLSLNYMYFIIEPPKSTETRLTGCFWFMQVNALIVGNSYYDNYSADYSKCQRPALTTGLE